ncbi:hypothetical protein LMG3441_03321 [Achromobacter kerstersii]|uniref:Uncharacterized protein n=2 Tax=Achromobacter kerstersii TaxID=1353890 RepID=A0A6S7B2T9_9BURK|nr:hypothetical protein LMG3441_03321 [Achromobacter kerstersii]
MLYPHQVRVVWTRNKGGSADTPAILIGPEAVLTKFLPKMLAFPGGISPITSVMRTWFTEDFDKAGALIERPLGTMAAFGFVGLIMGELLMTGGGDTDLRFVGGDGVRRTLSFVCAQALMRGWPSEFIADILGRWLEASVLTANEVDVEARVHIARMCGFLQSVSDLEDRKGATERFLAEQIQAWAESQVSSSQRDFLQRSLPQVVQSLNGIQSREKRFDIIMEALKRSDGETRNPLEQGFLISLIEPGSFEFLELSKKYDDKGGAVSVAYCAFTVMFGKEVALRQFNGFGLAVLNNSLQLNGDENSDISISELRILHDIRRADPIVFRTRSPWLVDVELAPMVSGSFGNVIKRRAAAQRSEQRSDAAEREELLRENLGTALRALESAYGLIEVRRSKPDSAASSRRRPKDIR